jgi:hypothetical protein
MKYYWLVVNKFLRTQFISRDFSHGKIIGEIIKKVNFSSVLIGIEIANNYLNFELTKFQIMLFFN